MKHKAGVYEKYIKRMIDIFCSAAFIVVFCWLFVLLAVLVRIKLGSPILFRQPRPGKDEKIFNLIKFRTMTDDRDENGNLLPDEVRLTKFGKWLRSTSLDELPEVFLIFTGKLSICGPRPLLCKYLDLYSPEQHRRHEVTPGLTGYAQVHGRNAISWEEKFALDVWYVDHVSFKVDLMILLKTLSSVFRREGISSDTSATMEEFVGSERKIG